MCLRINDSMKEITSVEEFKAIQLQILKDLDAFVRNNNIYYSLAYGSLIGVIRHHGFIPWDDDIDIYMERAHYQHLIDLLPNNYLGKYEMACLEKNAAWNRPYAKLFDMRTLLIESVSNNTGIGVGIDIFPVDEIPGESKEFRQYNREMFLLRNIYTLKSLKWMINRPFYKNVLVLLSKAILFPFKYRSMAMDISKKAQKYNGADTGFLADNVAGYASTKPFLKESFSEYINMTFEGFPVMVIKGWHDVLTKTFGAYMQLPPEEKRVTHHAFEAWWK